MRCRAEISAPSINLGFRRSDPVEGPEHENDGSAPRSGVSPAHPIRLDLPAGSGGGFFAMIRVWSAQ